MMTMRIREFYDRLFAEYGEQHWWPCRRGGRWEMIAGAVLTQNCAWSNVEKALDNLECCGLNTPQSIWEADAPRLQTAIRPAGFFNQKSVYLKAFAEFFLRHESEYVAPDASAHLTELRQKLLKVRGAGRETADSILLYAFELPCFVIDAYTRRAAMRHLGLDGTLPYDGLKLIFERELKPDVRMYNEFHALIVRHGKEHCRKNSCDWHQITPPSAPVATR